MEQNLPTFLTSLASGGGTFLVARWLLQRFIEAGYCHTRRQRFFAVYLLSFILAGGAYGLLVALGYATYSQEALFTSLVTAFAASQALWGIFEAKEVEPVVLTTTTETQPIGDTRSLAGLLPANVVLALAKAGFRTVQDVIDVTDVELLRKVQPHGLGPGAVKKIYEEVNR